MEIRRAPEKILKKWPPRCVFADVKGDGKMRTFIGSNSCYILECLSHVVSNGVRFTPFMGDGVDFASTLGSFYCTRMWYFAV